MSNLNLVQTTPFNQKVTVLDDAKFRLIGDPLEGNQPNRLPYLNFDLHGNNPRIRVNLNNGKKQEEGRIDLNLDIVAFHTLLSMMEDASRAQQPMCNFMNVMRAGFDRATNRPKEPYVYAVIGVGKDEDGCEFIAVQRGSQGGKNFVKLKFYFTTPEFHPVVDISTGQRVSRQKISNLVIRGYVRMLSQYMTLLHTFTYDYATTPEGKYAAKRAAENGGNNGGSNYRANNYSNGGGSGSSASTSSSSGGYNSSSSASDSFDENLPW